MIVPIWSRSDVYSLEVDVPSVGPEGGGVLLPVHVIGEDDLVVVLERHEVGAVVDGGAQAVARVVAGGLLVPLAVVRVLDRVRLHQEAHDARRLELLQALCNNKTGRRDEQECISQYPVWGRRREKVMMYAYTEARPGVDHLRYYYSAWA